MRRAGLALAVAAGAPGMLAGTASACPVCVSDTGVQIRAMLAVDPAWHLAATMAPIPVLLAAVAGVRLATPWLSQEREGPDG